MTRDLANLAGRNGLATLGFVLLVLRMGSGASWAQAGAVDESFAHSSDPRGRVWAVALQPDGKILVAGEFAIAYGADRNFVCRLNADGTSDSQFLPEMEPNGQASALLLMPDGKILVGGDFYDQNTIGHRGVVRLNADGWRDMSFDSSTATLGRVGHMQLQPDGGLLVSDSFRLARLLNDGRPDPSFQANPGFPFGIAQVEALALQADGKILVAGFHTRFNSDEQSGLMRLYPDHRSAFE